MSAYPARIPASVFTNPRRRRPSLKGYSPTSPLKTRNLNLNTNLTSPDFDDVYIPRPPTFMSIAYLREAISNIDVKMAALTKERADLETKLETAVRLQSPVLRLPSELLSNIFTIGVLQMGDEDPVMVATLMLVWQVNSPTTQPQELQTYPPLLVDIGPILEKARRRLMRSKSHPLDIIVNFGIRPTESPHAIRERVLLAMDLIHPALWRTKSFSLTVPNRAVAHEALIRCQEDAPTLEKLSILIQNMQDDHHYSKRPVPLFNGRTPNLRSCSITSFNFGWDLKLMNGLRVLKLGGYYNSDAPSPTTLLNILRQCPQLEELALRNVSIDDPHPCIAGKVAEPETPITNKIHLPHLKKASFFYSGGRHTQEIMSHITFSNLEHLELGYLENINTLLQLLYSQALTRLPLKFLRIENCLFGEITFMTLIRRLSSLVTLELVDNEDISNHTLKVLASASPWPCPRLERLSVSGCLCFDWDALRSLIENRLPANPHALKRYHTSVASLVSSASAAAAEHERMRTRQSQDRHGQSNLIAGPQRIKVVDVSGCTQISKEMLQWLRMYVASVKCDLIDPRSLA
ncbi:hypothetical protein CVT24_011323 [Panaeolus cyanescens]|uniref:F-box domain-containing protein n=1 Tax=Panaeolus cyanescens TaxID=181874 RepID=A0A409WDQ2_9AGAR|nr:hypothetical protein CVT24_011323 [Panaeolus cyanescens]